jgi:hypothetical protein
MTTPKTKGRRHISSAPHDGTVIHIETVAGGADPRPLFSGRAQWGQAPKLAAYDPLTGECIQEAYVLVGWLREGEPFLVPGRIVGWLPLASLAPCGTLAADAEGFRVGEVVYGETVTGRLVRRGLPRAHSFRDAPRDETLADGAVKFHAATRALQDRLPPVPGRVAPAGFKLTPEAAWNAALWEAEGLPAITAMCEGHCRDEGKGGIGLHGDCTACSIITALRAMSKFTRSTG